MHIETDLSIISSNWLKKANFDLSNEKMAEEIFHKFKQKTVFLSNGLFFFERCSLITATVCAYKLNNTR